MTETEFWILMDQTRLVAGRDTQKQADLIIETLKSMPEQDILDYNELMTHFIDRAYIADLWDAASIIGCGCGNDTFMDFRAWLVGQGREVYENAIIEPATLVDLVEIDQNTQVQDLWSSASIAYFDLTGEDIPLERRDAPELIGKSRSDAEKIKRFPKLHAKFGNCAERANRGFMTI